MTVVQTFADHVPSLLECSVWPFVWAFASFKSNSSLASLVRRDVAELNDPWGWSIPLGAVGLYGILLLLPNPKQPWRGWKTTFALRVWNLVLCVASAFMFWGMLLPFFLLPRHDLICMFPERWDVPITSGYWFSHLFLYSKLVELGDTVWLKLRGKRVSFLHAYHHISVLLFCWHCVVERFWPGVYFSVINAFVHFIMYHYYYAATFGRVGYAKLLTVLQIGQMAVGLIVTLVWTVRHLLDHVACPLNSAWSVPFALVVYGSYLGLFLRYYCRRYR